MTSIRQIPYEDIELFLLTNDIDLSSDININYDLAYKLMKKADSNFEIESILEWMIAHNLIVLKYEIPKYKKSEILELSDIELRKLARSLTMKNHKIDNILNILNYLDKLIDDLKNNIFSGNPFLQFSNQSDIIFETLKDLEIDDIINFCVSSTKINKTCTSPNIVNLIRSKLQELDDLDLSTYNLEELLLFNKIKKFKYNNTTNIFFGKETEITDIIIYLNRIMSDFIEVDKIGNIIKFDGKFAIITVTGNCYIWDNFRKKATKINDIYGIIQVVSSYGITWYLTSRGEVYLSYKYKIISDNIIKINNNIIDYKITDINDVVELYNGFKLYAVTNNEKSYILDIIDGVIKKLNLISY